jgi:hypothetical protein
MGIDWKQKIMRFQLEAEEITPVGVKDNTVVCAAVSHKGLKGLLRKNAISHWIEISILHQ